MSHTLNSSMILVKKKKKKKKKSIYLSQIIVILLFKEEVLNCSNIFHQLCKIEMITKNVRFFVSQSIVIKLISLVFQCTQF